jgi:hypothetical protein
MARMISACRAPTPEGPWQICVQRVDGGEEVFATQAKEGSNPQPDWHGDE